MLSFLLSLSPIPLSLFLSLFFFSLYMCVCMCVSACVYPSGDYVIETRETSSNTTKHPHPHTHTHAHTQIYNIDCKTSIENTAEYR